MIELPRACLVADRIAEHADFFSFGTNDLTQTTFGPVARRRRPVPARATSRAACSSATRSSPSTGPGSAR